jgi:hypothetical protein
VQIQHRNQLPGAAPAAVLELGLQATLTLFRIRDLARGRSLHIAAASECRQYWEHITTPELQQPPGCAAPPGRMADAAVVLLALLRHCIVTLIMIICRRMWCWSTWLCCFPPAGEKLCILLRVCCHSRFDSTCTVGWILRGSLACMRQAGKTASLPWSSLWHDADVPHSAPRCMKGA